MEITRQGDRGERGPRFCFFFSDIYLSVFPVGAGTHPLSFRAGQEYPYTHRTSRLGGLQPSALASASSPPDRAAPPPFPKPLLMPQVSRLKQAQAYTLFPPAKDLISIESRYGETISKEDIWGAGGKEASGEWLGGEADRGENTPW
jgi:hypothetical protein